MAIKKKAMSMIIHTQTRKDPRTNLHQSV